MAVSGGWCCSSTHGSRRGGSRCFLAEGDGRWMLEHRQWAEGINGIGVFEDGGSRQGSGGAATVDCGLRVFRFSPLVDVIDLKEEDGEGRVDGDSW